MNERSAKCNLCNANVITEQMIQEKQAKLFEMDQKEKQDILQSIQENEEMSNQFNELGELLKETKQDFFSYQKKGNQLQRAFRKEIKCLNDLIKNKLDEYHTELKKSAQSAKWRLQSQKTKRAIANFEQVYSGFPLYKAMKMKFPEWNLPAYQLMKLYFYSPTVHRDYIFVR